MSFRADSAWACTVAAEPHLPKGWQDDFDVIAAPLDWLGVNYYTCKRIAAAEGPWPQYAYMDGPLTRTQMGWEIYPDGLYHFLKMAHEDYARGLPIYVTESGMANPDTAGGADPERTDYIDVHLAQALRAIDEGIPLRGFTYWSLLDNYEWSLGYEKRFGLVHVDFETQQRTPKASYHALARALTS